MVKLRAFIFGSIMYLNWGYPQSKIYASANNILKIMILKKITFCTFWPTYMPKILTPTLICYCVHDNILQVPQMSTHFIFSCQLPNELRSPWTYFLINYRFLMFQCYIVIINLKNLTILTNVEFFIDTKV